MSMWTIFRTGVLLISFMAASTRMTAGWASPLKVYTETKREHSNLSRGMNNPGYPVLEAVKLLARRGVLIL
jgi:hypothetical protein